MNSLGVLLKGRFCFSRSGWNLRFCFSSNSQIMLLFPDHTVVVARPMDVVMSILSKRGHSYIQGLRCRKGEAEWRRLPWWLVSLLLTVLGWNLSYTAMPSARTSEKCNLAGQPCTQLQFCCWQTPHSPCHIPLSKVPSCTSQRLVVTQSGEVLSEKCPGRLPDPHFMAFFPSAHSWNIPFPEFPEYRGGLPRREFESRLFLSTFPTLEVNQMIRLYRFKILLNASFWVRKKNWCLKPSVTLFWQRQPCWSGSTGLQVFLSGEWDKITDESRPLVRYTGSTTMNHNHSTFAIKPQFMHRQTATLDG